MSKAYGYAQTDSHVLIGSKDAAGTRTGVELENTYSTTEVTEPTKSLNVAGFEKLTINGLYTMGSGESANSIEIKLESSPDGTNWYQTSNESTTGGTSTLTNREWTFVGADAAAKSFEIFVDIAYQYVRISCKETGVGTNKGNVFVEATLAGA